MPSERAADCLKIFHEGQKALPTPVKWTSYVSEHAAEHLKWFHGGQKALPTLVKRTYNVSGRVADCLKTFYEGQKALPALVKRKYLWTRLTWWLKKILEKKEFFLNMSETFKNEVFLARRRRFFFENRTFYCCAPPPCYWVPENKGGHNNNGEYQIRVPPYLAGRRPENFGGFWVDKCRKTRSFKHFQSVNRKKNPPAAGKHHDGLENFPPLHA